jgi:hypothetical protein
MAKKTTMSNELQNLLKSIELSSYSDYPYENLYATNLFSDDFYNKILDNLPPLESYFGQAGGKTKASVARLNLPIGRDYHKFHSIWKEVADILSSDELKTALWDKFKKTVRHEHCDPYSILLRDQKDYVLPPHPDIPPWKRNGRAMNLMIYLPHDNSHENCGTIVNTKEGGQFKEHKRFKFHRNSACAFPVVENSWHSVEHLTDSLKLGAEGSFVRHSLLLAYHVPDEKGLYKSGYDLYTNEYDAGPHQ